MARRGLNRGLNRSLTGVAAVLAMVLLAGSGVRAQEGFVPSERAGSDAPAHDLHSEPAAGATVTPFAPAASAAAGGAGAAGPVAAAAASVATTPRPAAPTGPGAPDAADLARLREGFLAAASNNWDGVRNARSLSTSPVVRKILQWRLASDTDSPLSFDEVRTALDQLQGWPSRETIRRRAEQAIFDSGLSPAQRIAWLQNGGPLSGDGKVALAQALKMSGRRDEAATVLRDAWRSNTLTPRAEALATSDLSDLLRSVDHVARVDWALWRDDRATANRLIPRLPADAAAVARARIALQTRPRKGLQAAVDRVPESRRDDAGFLYDRTRYYRITGRPELAAPIAARIESDQAPPGLAEQLYREKRRYVTSSLRAGARSQAYALVADHGVVDGETFAEAEWLAGWIALRFTRDYGLADSHFEKMDAGVVAPISKARAAYWRAQSTRVLGRPADANAFMQTAARYNFTYYGLLAADQLGGSPMLSLGAGGAIDPAERAAFEAREVVQALRLVALAGDQRNFESFAFYIDDTLNTPAEHAMLAQIAREQAYTRIAVRSAKAGMRRGILAPDAAYPLLDLPPDARKPGRPEPALILGIARQESEFDPRAVSGAGARGLMQLMDGTARITARLEGLPYQRSWLIDDPSYNITLGAAHLQHLLEDWDGSYVLTIASYNAGPNRAREWIGDWGDPRSRSVDVVDWIELIPFSETRNYVQRVLENVQVYRHRLAGTPVPVQIEKDLRRGAY